MSRKSFLIRVRPEILAGLKALAEQEMRSLNGQIEFILRQALQSRGLLEKKGKSDKDVDHK